MIENSTVFHRPSPEYAILELTHSCPALCPGCSVSSGGCPGEALGLADWERLIKELSRYVSELRISGGEAANYPHFAPIITCVEKARVPFVLFTAGLWEEPERTIDLLRNSSMLKGLCFSLHGERKDIHEAFTGVDSFQAAVENMERCREAGIQFQTSSVLGEFNKRHVKEIIRFVFQMGSRGHVFHRYIGPVRQGISLFREELSALLNYVKKIEQAGLPVYGDGCLPSCFFPHPFKCLAGLTYCSIDPHGNVKPCPFSGRIAGNVKIASVKRIWTKKTFKKLREEVPDECARCVEVHSCRGGCHTLRDRFGIQSDPLFEEPLMR